MTRKKKKKKKKKKSHFFSVGCGAQRREGGGTNLGARVGVPKVTEESPLALVEKSNLLPACGCGT